MADEMVLDSPALDVNEPVEQVEEGIEQLDAQETAQPDAEEVKGDERVIPQWMRELKAVNPAAFKEAKGLFFGKRTLDEKLKDFDLDGTKSWLLENGGREGLVQTLQEREAKAAELDSLNEAIAKGDPSIVAQIAENSPEAFPALAQAAFQQWQQRDPEGWTASMSGIMAATIQNAGVPMFLERMAMQLEFGKTQELQQSIAQLLNWAGSFQQRAAAPRQQAQPAAQAKNPERDAELQQARQIRNENYRSKVEAFRVPAIEKELGEYLKLRGDSPELREMAIDRVRADVAKQLAGDKNYQDALKKFESKGDIDGALKLISSREAQVIKDVAPKIGRVLFGQLKTAPKTEAPKTAAPKVSQVQRTATPANRADAIFARIAAR